MYESRRQPLIRPADFLRRVLGHVAAALLLVAGSLALGMAGYMRFEGLASLDAFLEAAMLLGGMGPLKAPVTGAGKPIPIGAFYSALITFTLFEAAYYCEIMRAGIQSVPRGQVSAGYALGLDYWQTMAKIVLPQAFRNMLPVLLTQTIILFQDTSLVYVLSITDFLGAAAKVAQRDGRLIEMYLLVAVVYFIISFSLSLLVKRLQGRIAIVR